MSGLELGQMIGHGFAKLTGAQRDAGATSPVAATETGSVVLPDGTEMLRSASGNIGFGVTPSAWSSDYKVHQVGSTASFYGRVAIPVAGVANNAYRDAPGNWLYQTTGVPAVRYEQDTGSHIWYTAPSGTAGNQISFTQAMTLEASGHVGIGTASPNTQLHVTSTTNGWITLQRGNDASNIAWQSWSNADGSNKWGLGMLSGSNNLSILNYATGSLAGVFDSAGNLGIGTASPTHKLDVNIGNLSGAKLFKFTGATAGGSLFGYSDSGGVGITRTDPYNSMVYLSNTNNVEFYTAGTQRGVFDSAGNLGIGVSPIAGLGKVQVAGNICAGRIGTPVHIQDTADTNYGNAIYIPYDGGSSTQKAFRIRSSYSTGALHFDPSTNSQAQFTNPATLTYGTGITLDTAGNLLVGETTGGVEKLTIAGRTFLANQSAPATPAGGGVIYVEDGALKYKGSSGTVTTLAPA